MIFKKLATTCLPEYGYYLLFLVLVCVCTPVPPHRPAKRVSSFTFLMLFFTLLWRQCFSLKLEIPKQPVSLQWRDGKPWRSFFLSSQRLLVHIAAASFLKSLPYLPTYHLLIYLPFIHQSTYDPSFIYLPTYLPTCLCTRGDDHVYCLAHIWRSKDNLQ